MVSHHKNAMLKLKDCKMTHWPYTNLQTHFVVFQKELHNLAKKDFRWKRLYFVVCTWNLRIAYNNLSNTRLDSASVTCSRVSKNWINLFNLVCIRTIHIYSSSIFLMLGWLQPQYLLFITPLPLKFHPGWAGGKYGDSKIFQWRLSNKTIRIIFYLWKTN